MHSLFKLLVKAKQEYEKGLTPKEKQDGVKFDSTPYLSAHEQLKKLKETKGLFK
jgi:hypothetical protein